MEIMSEKIDANELPKLKIRFYESMAYLERDFPLALLVFLIFVFVFKGEHHRRFYLDVLMSVSSALEKGYLID